MALSRIEYTILQLKSQLFRFLDFIAPQLSRPRIKYTGNTRACIAPEDRGSSIHASTSGNKPRKAVEKTGCPRSGYVFRTAGCPARSTAIQLSRSISRRCAAASPIAPSHAFFTHTRARVHAQKTRNTPVRPLSLLETTSAMINDVTHGRA